MSALDSISNTDVPPAEEYGESVTLKLKQIGDGVVGVLRRRAEVNTAFGEKEVFNFTDVEAAVSEGVAVTVPAGEEAAVWPTPGFIRAVDHVSAGIGDKIAVKLVDLKDTGKGNPAKIFGATVLERKAGTAPAAADVI